MIFNKLNFQSKVYGNNFCNIYNSRKGYSSYQRKNKFLSFDLSIHNTMSDFNKLLELDRLNIKELYALLDKNWNSEGNESSAEERKFKLRAYRMLTVYFSNPQDIGIESLVINRNLSMKVSKGKLLFARIDKAYERKDGGLEIVDYKSGYVIQHEDNFTLRLKSAAFILLFNYKFGVYPDYLSYYYLNYNRKFTCRITEKEIEFVNSII